jgi:ABC-type nitrate/sulfonate/bicarbonate transport system substrate-binding protein
MCKFAKFGFLRLIGTVSLATCLGVLSHPAGAVDKVRIGGVPFYSSALVYVAQDKGFWKQSGLDIEIIDFAGGPLVNEALMGGGIDLGMGVGAGPAVALASRGAGVVIIAGEAYAGEISAPPDRLMVSANSPIKDVKELDGKPVAVHAKGSISYVMLQVIAKASGITPVILEVPAPSQFAALKRGDVTAVMAETPFPEQMLVEGGRSIYDLPNNTVVPYMAATVTLTTGKYAREHPDVIDKVLGVAMRTERWIMDNPLEARDAITARLRYKPEVIKVINPICYKWSRNGLFLISSIKWWGREMRTLNVIQSEPDYTKYFVSTYAETAAKIVGYQTDPDFDALANHPIP